MTLRFIGAAAECEWLAQELHTYIQSATKPRLNAKTGLYRVYFDVKTPVTKPQNPSNAKQKA